MDISASMRIIARDAGGAVEDVASDLPHPAPIGPAGACVSEPVRVSASNTIGSTIRRADRQAHRHWAASARNRRPALTVHALRALGTRNPDHQPAAINGWSR